MKLKYYGTAAAEGIPSMFGCQCETCEKTRALGGRNIRTRSQAAVDDKILIDFPPDTYLHTLYHNLNLNVIKNCLITHNHSDHLYAEDFYMRRKIFYYPKEESILTVYGAKATVDAVHSVLKGHQDTRIVVKEIQPYEEFYVEDYAVTPLKAEHAEFTAPVIYMISHSGKTILYGHDTGYFSEETWAYLERKKPYFDLISLDCTEALKSTRQYHMGLEAIRDVAARLREIGCIDAESKICVNHFSHNGGATYDELVEIVKKDGFIVSYDGMELII